MTDMQHIVDAITSGEASSDDVAALPVPDHYTAALLRQEDESMFDGLPAWAEVKFSLDKSRSVGFINSSLKY